MGISRNVWTAKYLRITHYMSLANPTVYVFIFFSNRNKHNLSKKNWFNFFFTYLGLYSASIIISLLWNWYIHLLSLTMATYDDFIKKTDGAGIFQKRLAFILIFVSIPSGLQIMLTVFLTYTPPHRCKLPVEQDIINEINISNYINMSIPHKYGSLSKCKRYDYFLNSSNAVNASTGNQVL